MRNLLHTKKDHLLDTDAAWKISKPFDFALAWKDVSVPDKKE